jgi:hypothetical protein
LQGPDGPTGRPGGDNSAMELFEVAKVGFLPDRLAPYISLMLAGFFVGMFGHLARSKWLVTTGIVMVFLATLGFPLALQVGEDNPPVAPDARLREMPDGRPPEFVP